MRALLRNLAILSLTWTVSQAAAPDSTYRPSDAHALNARRQLIECMNRRMAASRTLSYNEASRICKDQMKDQLVAQQGPVAAANPQKSVSAP